MTLRLLSHLILVPFEQVTSVFIAVLSKVPDEVARTNEAIQKLKIEDSPFIGPDVLLEGKDALLIVLYLEKIEFY